MLAGAVWLGAAQAAPVEYTTRSGFDAAVNALPGVSVSTLNFDSTSAPSPIARGASLEGIAFTYDLGGVMLQITAGVPTTSSPNFLGTDDAGVLQDGDDFTPGFAPVNAIGLYLMSRDALFDEDFRLSAGGSIASLSATDLQQTLGDGTQVYFLGLVDAGATFTSASLTTPQNGVGYFLWNADDIVTATSPVPESGTAAMSLIGLVALGLARATRRRT